MNNEHQREINFRTGSSRDAAFKDVKILPCTTMKKWWIGERRELEYVDNMLKSIGQEGKQDGDIDT
ncbi:MAG: hypothetical protein M1840_007208 [Geoglossum simile]|nr:MAG: hypothetical protein M1840_007208 [Geoglossum simile]